MSGTTTPSNIGISPLVSTSPSEPNWPKAKHHHYPLHLQCLALELLSFPRIGLRTAVQILALLRRLGAWPGACRVPAHTTLRQWRLKFGLAHLPDYGLRRDFCSTDTWVVIIDESITIGKDRLLVLLGVRLENFSFDRALRLEDVEVLDLQIKASFPAQAVEQRLQALIDRGCRISYLVSDGGGNFVKAARQLGLPRVADVSHALANLLRRTYAAQPWFVAFEQQCTRLKRRGAVAAYAHLLPPKHRAHSRFMNIGTVLNWAIQTLRLIKEQSRHEWVRPYLDQIDWLLEYEEPLQSMYRAVNLVKQLLTALKNKGLPAAPTALLAWQATIQQAALPDQLAKGIYDYLHTHQQMARRLEVSHLIASSDVIESCFGRYKSQLEGCSKQLTAQCLQIAAFGKKITTHAVKDRLEACRVVDLQRWQQSNLRKTAAARRRSVYALVKSK